MKNWSTRETPAALRGVGNRDPKKRGKGPICFNVLAYCTVKTVTGQEVTFPKPPPIKRAESTGMGLARFAKLHRNKA